jgi:hypothetical protein
VRSLFRSSCGVFVRNDYAELWRGCLASRKDARLDFQPVVVAIGGPKRPDDHVEGSGTAGITHGDRGGHPEDFAAEQDRRIVDGEDPLADDGRFI